MVAFGSEARPFRLHDVRASAASLMLAAGASISDVSRWLGHSTLSITTDLYGHLVPDRLQGIVRRAQHVFGGDGR